MKPPLFVTNASPLCHYIVIRILCYSDLLAPRRRRKLNCLEEVGGSGAGAYCVFDYFSSQPAASLAPQEVKLPGGGGWASCGLVNQVCNSCAPLSDLMRVVHVHHVRYALLRMCLF